MEEKELNERLNLVVQNMFEIGSDKISDGTPLQGIFLALSTAIIATGSENKQDEDVVKASVDLIDALGSVVNSSRLLREIEIQCDIHNLVDEQDDGLD